MKKRTENRLWGCYSYHVCRNDCECIAIAVVAPFRRGKLQIDIYEGGRVSGTFCGDGQMRGEGCFAGPAFPAQDC